MARKCKICTHHKVKKIDKALIQGQSKSEIARTYGIPYHSVDYHSKHHLSRQLATAYQHKDLQHSLDLVNELEHILTKAKTILDRNMDKDTYHGDELSLKSLSEIRSSLELAAKMKAFLYEVDNQDDEIRQQMAIQDKMDYLDDEELQLFTDLLHKMDVRYKSRYDDAEKQMLEEAQAEPVPEQDDSVPVQNDDTQDDDTPTDTEDAPKPRMKRTKPPASSKQIPGTLRSRRRYFAGLDDD